MILEAFFFELILSCSPKYTPEIPGLAEICNNDFDLIALSHFWYVPFDSAIFVIIVTVNLVFLA